MPDQHSDPTDFDDALRYVVFQAECAAKHAAARQAILSTWPSYVLRDASWIAADEGVRAAYAELDRRGER